MAAFVFSLCILAINALLVLLFQIGFWEILWDQFYEAPMCNEVAYHCLYPWVALLLLWFASYSYGIFVGLGVTRGILRMGGNYLGTFAYGLIGAVPTLFILIPSPFYILLVDLHIAIILGTALAVMVGVAAGFGYVKEGWGFLSWVRVLGVVSGAFFLFIGIVFLFSSIRGYESYF